MDRANGFSLTVFPYMKRSVEYGQTEMLPP